MLSPQYQKEERRGGTLNSRDNPGLSELRAFSPPILIAERMIGH